MWQHKALILTIGFIAIVPAVFTDISDNIKNDVLHIAHILEEEFLNDSFDPCENFYDFVCAKNLENISKLNELKLDFSLLTQSPKKPSKPEKAARSFYASCRDSRSIRDLKSTLMYRMSGGWPAIEKSSDLYLKHKNTHWMSVLTAFHSVGGVPYLFEYSVEIKSNRRVVTITPRRKQHYDLPKYEELMNQVLTEYQVEAAKLRLIGFQTLAFEISLRNIFAKNSTNTLNSPSVSYYKHVRTPVWDNYFKKMLGKTLKRDDVLILQDAEKLEQLGRLLGNTNLTHLLNWIWIDYLLDKRAENCQQLTMNYFQPLIEYNLQSIYNQVEMTLMYSEILIPFSQDMLEFFDNETLGSARYFAATMMKNAVHRKKEIDDKYAYLNLGHENFFRNLEKVQRFLQQQKEPKPNAEIEKQHSVYKKHFSDLYQLFRVRNLSAPLNYILTGQKFFYTLIMSENKTKTVSNVRKLKYPKSSHKSIFSLFGLRVFGNWIMRFPEMAESLDALLSVEPLQLSLEKLYFIGSTLFNDCEYSERKHILHNSLRYMKPFNEAFGCREPREEIG